MIGRKADDPALPLNGFGTKQGIIIPQCRSARLQRGEIILEYINTVIGRISDAIGAGIACA